MSFADNLKTLPEISQLQAIELLDDRGQVCARIENKPGSQGSLAIYNHLIQTYGVLTPEAAQAGLLLYAEHVEDAHQHPGRHPNIDRLIDLRNQPQTMRAKRVLVD